MYVEKEIAKLIMSKKKYDKYIVFCGDVLLLEDIPVDLITENDMLIPVDNTCDKQERFVDSFYIANNDNIIKILSMYDKLKELYCKIKHSKLKGYEHLFKQHCIHNVTNNITFYNFFFVKIRANKTIPNYILKSSSYKPKNYIPKVQLYIQNPTILAVT